MKKFKSQAAYIKSVQHTPASVNRWLGTPDEIVAVILPVNTMNMAREMHIYCIWTLQCESAAYHLLLSRSRPIRVPRYFGRQARRVRFNDRP